MKIIETMALTTVIFLIYLIVYAGAYHYLNFSESPKNADAVVLFVGPHLKKRMEEAHQLINEGYTDTLIIPAHHQICTYSDGNIIKYLNPDKNIFDKKEYPNFYENTHNEVLWAKTMMERVGFNSAIMVSSPYHMRRIKIISQKVFSEENWMLSFVGSRYLKKNRGFSASLLDNMQKTITEYVKIIVFNLYVIVENLNIQISVVSFK